MTSDPAPVRLTPLLRPRLLAQGESDGDIRGRRRRGEWQTLRPGVYLPAGQALTAQQRHLALLDSLLPSLTRGSIVSHASAAVLWGLPLWGVRLDRIHLTRQVSSGACRTAGLHVHSTPDEITAVDAGGMAVTALRAGLTTPAELAREAGQAVGRTGARRARAVVAFADARAESVGESRSRVAMHLAGLPAPELQVVIRDDAVRQVARTDFGYPDLRVAGEFDGKVKYGRLLRPGQSAGDAVFAEKCREDAIRDAGWIVIRWIWQELSHPELIIERWHRALARAARWSRP